MRVDVCKGLEFLGVKFSSKANKAKNNGSIREISKGNSKVKVLIIPTNEELVIARETAELL